MYIALYVLHFCFLWKKLLVKFCGILETSCDVKFKKKWQDAGIIYEHFQFHLKEREVKFKKERVALTYLRQPKAPKTSIKNTSIILSERTLPFKPRLHTQFVHVFFNIVVFSREFTLICQTKISSSKMNRNGENAYVNMIWQCLNNDRKRNQKN